MNVDLDRRAEEARPRQDSARARRRAVAVLVLALLLVIGYWPRASPARMLSEAATAVRDAVPVVAVSDVRQAPGETEVALPGSVQGVAETALFARADGYVRRRLVDIGDRVESGQLLAEIESPELDQQIREAGAAERRAQAAVSQAEGVMAQVRAQFHLAEVTAGRWKVLVESGVLSKQDGDEKQAALDARRADLEAAGAAVEAARATLAGSQAALARLQELQRFRQVRAPFAGVVTARTIDLGSLVSASATPGRELFRLARVDTVRVVVQVPQNDAAGIEPGLACDVRVDELRGHQFTGRLARTAGALDPVTRTMPVEVQVENRQGRLLPGMYATVVFRVKRTARPLLVPSAAVRQTPDGPVVGVVGEGEVVHLAAIELGRDYGTQMEVWSGLQAGQQVITSLSDAIVEGARVQVTAARPPASGGRGGGR